MFGGLREGIFECCNPASLGEPEFLAAEQHISSRSAANLYTSASGSLKLYFQKWQSDRHQNVRAVVFCHHGEAEHCVWYNALAVRLAAFGCTTFCPDVQGYGQSDGARGYFESFENLVCDFVKFCRLKWAEVLDAQSKGPQGTKPGLVFIGKGFGALVIMRALVELHQLASSWGVTPVVVLISPAFQFANFISEQSNVSCGLNQSQCARQPVAQCARAPVAFAPVGVEGQTQQKLEYMSRWFPKMIVTQPVDPDLVSRDPETIDRMNRDALCWRQGYRARVLAEIVQEQNCVTETLLEHPEVFQRAPALILHGTGDKLFSVHGSHSLHSVWCDVASKSGTYPRLKIYDGAFHQLLNEPNREEVMTDIAHFIAAKTGTS